MSNKTKATMTNEDGSSAANMFQRIYKDGNKATKEANATLAEKSLRRKLETSIDDAEGQIGQAQLRISTEREKLNDMDVNVITKQYALIRTLENAMADVNTEYAIMFGEPYYVAA